MTSLQTAISAAAERVGPSVVGLGRGWGRGSGVVIGDDQVLTNVHNVRRGEVDVTFADGSVEPGEVAGTDAGLDLAVLDVDTGGAPAVAWEPADAAPAIGAPVVALANPGGRGLRATPGFVSSEGRRFRGPRGRRMEPAIEHTAPLPRGSSGGPLVDPEGRLLGVNTLRLEGGLILAVAATAQVRDRVLGLARGEDPAPPRLGVAVAPPRVARRLRRAVGLPEREGILVRAVEEGSAAEAAGIEPGDLLVAAGERDLDSIDALYAALDAAAGGRAELSVVRGTEERQVEVSFEQKEAA